MSLTRRNALITGLSICCATSLPAAPASVATCAQGRIFKNSLGARLVVNNSEFALQSGSGDQGLDGSLELLAFDMTRAFDLRSGFWPALFFFSEADGRPNCFQVDTPIDQPLVSGTRGGVVIGKAMASQLLTSPAVKNVPGAALAAVVAHEFAHAYQRLNGIYDRLVDDDPAHYGQTPYRLLELHADLLAGFYMGRRSGFGAGAALDVTTAFVALGDSDFNNATHHGQPAERAVCMYRGLNLANVAAMTVGQAAIDGEQFVRQLSGAKL